MDDIKTGNSGNEPQVEDQATGDQPDDKSNPESQLGDAGKKALQEERAARKEAERQLSELKAEISRLRRSNAAVKDVDLEAIKNEIRQEFDAKLRTAEIKAAAAGKLADPSDVVRYGEYFEGLSADDADGIKSALEKLLKEKPYLAVQDSPTWGDVGQGAREARESEPSSPQERLARAYSRKA